MGDPRPASAPAAELSAFVQASVSDVRRANALGLAWLRLALRTLTLATYVRYLLGPTAARALAQLPAVFVNIAHLAVGAVVLALLLRRRHVGAAILAGAASDFAVVSIGAWRAAAGPDAQLALAFFMGAYELMLLFAALTLGTRVVAGLSAFSLAFLAALLLRLPSWDADSWLIVLFLAAFGAAVTFAGRGMVGLASRTAAEEYGAGLLRRHARELAATNEALRDARARTDLLTRLIVHDLRSPLTSVLATLDVVEHALSRAPVRDAEAEEALSLSRGEARRLVGMISDLLTVGKLEDGIRAQPVATDVGALLREVAAPHEAQAGSAGVSVRVAAPAGLTAALDPGLVRRSLENLVANALRHLEPGGRVEVSAEADGAALRLAVRNSGPPIPPELRDRIFDKHVSGSAADWARTGLGLHFCSLAAKAHGGRIALADRPGWNVSFEIELPGAEPRLAGVGS